MHNGRCKVMHYTEITDVGARARAKERSGKKKQARLSPAVESFVKNARRDYPRPAPKDNRFRRERKRERDGESFLERGR